MKILNRAINQNLYMHNEKYFITILGTGNALATRCYNTCFTLHSKEKVLLVDAGGGNGILTQLERAGICDMMRVVECDKNTFIFLQKNSLMSFLFCIFAFYTNVIINLQILCIGNILRILLLF